MVFQENNKKEFSQLYNKSQLDSEARIEEASTVASTVLAVVEGNGESEIESDHALKPKRISAAKIAMNIEITHREQLKQLMVKSPISKRIPSLRGEPVYTYYLCKSNGWKLVQDALDKRGWKEIDTNADFNKTNKYCLKWVQKKSQINYRSHNSGQLVNRIENNDVICTKIGLLVTLRDTFCKQVISSSNASSSLPRDKSPRRRKRNNASPTRSPIRIDNNHRYRRTPWLPETYQLEVPSDVQAVLQREAESQSQDGCGLVWIYKPSNCNRGIGIRVFTGEETLRQICFGSALKNGLETHDQAHLSEAVIESCEEPPKKGIIQVYIQRPLLIGKEGFKFDIRCYMLIARNFPCYAVFYHPGYCRLTLKPYSLNMDTLHDSTIHLTNAAIQKKDSLYSDRKEFQIQTVASVANRLETETGNKESADYLLTRLDHDIKRCMVDILKVCF
jgi:hypothetical protein